MQPISSSTASLEQTVGTLGGGNSNVPAQDQLEVREAFQDFVAGTFYKEMLKALRSTQQKPAYFHGGQAEEIFQGQLDQQVAEDLAKGHGANLADPLFKAFSQQIRLNTQPVATAGS